MSNPLTMQVESGLGAVFILLLAGFFVGLLFVAIKNYDSDTIVLAATQAQVQTISSTERELIGQWIQDNNITIPDGKGYKWVMEQYPDKPWLHE